MLSFLIWKMGLTKYLFFLGIIVKSKLVNACKVLGIVVRLIQEFGES